MKAGEIVGFLGVNGAGKTTSFLLASGLLKPQQGQIRVLEVDPAESREWTRQVGVLTAGSGVYPRLTVRRNLSFFAELYGAKIDLDTHLKAHGLADYANKKASQLSQGYRRRLSLARATVNSPRLLLLDEPAEGLDPAATEHLHQYLRTFVANGGGVLFTSHRLEEVEQLCQRIILLDGGKICLEGSPEMLTQSGREGGLRGLVLELQSSLGREPQ